MRGGQNAREHVRRSEHKRMSEHVKRSEHVRRSEHVKRSEHEPLADFLTPEFHQLRQNNEACFLGNGVGEVDGTLDDGEDDPLHILCP